MIKKLLFVLVIVFANTSISQTSFGSYTPKPEFPYLYKDVPTSLNNFLDYKWVNELYASPNNDEGFYIKPLNVYDIEREYRSWVDGNDLNTADSLLVQKKTIHTQNMKHLLGAVYLNNYYDEDTGDVTVPVGASLTNSQNLVASSSQGDWSFIGPFDTYTKNGVDKMSRQTNVYTLEQSKSNPDVIITGTETGAVFISTDKGDNFINTADELGLGSRSIGAVDIDPNNSNVMYIAASNSLYKTTDQGANWTSILSISGLGASDISINPDNSNEILLASYKGLHRTLDGGTTWELLLNNGRCWDIERKTDDPKTVFVAKTNTANNVVEIQKSTDVTITTPVFVAKTSGYFSPTNAKAKKVGGARLAVTNADANRVYVLLLGSDVSNTEDVNFLGVYMSTDAAENWTLPYDGDNDGQPDNDPGGPYSATDWCLSCFGFGNTLTGGGDYNQGFYNAGIDVSDTDPDLFLVGMLSMFKSDDGGKSFTPWGGYICDNCGDGFRHPDIQEIEINGSDMWVANDGGLDLYSADSFNWLKTRNKGMNATEYWGFGQGWQQHDIVGGRYHNGNAAYRPAYSDGRFVSLGGGEAPTGYINALDPSNSSFSDITGKVVPEVITGGTPNTPIRASVYPNEEIYSLNRRSEVVPDPRWSDVNYLGKGSNLWLTVDQGKTYNAIKLFTESGIPLIGVTDIEVSRDNPDILYVTTLRYGSGSWQAAKTFKLSNLDAVIEYASTNNADASDFSASLKALVNTEEVILPAAHSNTEIQVATDDVNELYYTTGNNGSGNLDKVFKSIDGGATWTNLTTATLAKSVKFLIIQDGTEGGVYAVNNDGVFYRNDSMSDWVNYSNGLPTKKSFNKLIPFYRDNKLRGATYNRGMVEASLFEKSLPIAQPIASKKTVSCSREEIQFEDYSVLEYDGASWLWDFPGAATVSSITDRNPIVTYASVGEYDVTLTVTDALGNVSTKTVTGMVTFDEDLCGGAITDIGGSLDTKKGGRNNLYLPDFNIDNINELTVATWVKPTGTQSNYAGIFTFMDSASGKNVALNVLTTNELRIHWESSKWNVSTGLFLDVDKWNYVAFVAEPTGVTIYLNNEKKFIPFTVNQVNLDAFFINNHTGTYRRNFNGNTDEFKIWSRSLSENEIRDERHIIETDISDPTLLSYYQFNNMINGNTVYDKKATRDLIAKGSSKLSTSTAPIGPGFVVKQNVTSAGMVQFQDSGVSINFDSGVIPDGELVVSRIITTPDESPNLTNGIEESYYVINNYGANTTFDPLLSISFTDVNNLGNVTSSDIGLFKRESNDDTESTWSSEIAATSDFDANTGTVTFNNPTFTSFSQFFLGSSQTLSNQKVESAKDFKVYPIPVTAGCNINIDGIKGKYKMSIISLTGKVLMKAYTEETSLRIPASIASGVYLYLIETDNKIRTGKITIE